LKLRAIAKRAGVSHTAADPHFGDLTGLLSELAAIGYERLHDAMSGTAGEAPGARRTDAREIARGYIGFARANPDLFMLMFRGDTLDMTRPRLQQAARNSYLALGAATASGSGCDSLSLANAGREAAAWGLVHGLAMLLINGRFRPILSRIDPEPEPDALIEAALGSLSFS
jgi:AcrR family transcriptional regulator